MKEKEKLTDEACVAVLDTFQHHLPTTGNCATHKQPLADCANQRLKYVKAAREMDERSMASARAWQKIAGQYHRERDEAVEKLRLLTPRDPAAHDVAESQAHEAPGGGLRNDVHADRGEEEKQSGDPKEDATHGQAP